MNVRFVSQDSAWTESKKIIVANRIVSPLLRHNPRACSEICFLLEITWRKRPELSPLYSLWAVAQNFDGGSQKIFRRDGSNFDKVAHGIFEDIKRGSRPPTAIARLSARLFGN